MFGKLNFGNNPKRFDEFKILPKEKLTAMREKYKDSDVLSEQFIDIYKDKGLIE